MHGSGMAGRNTVIQPQFQRSCSQCFQSPGRFIINFITVNIHQKFMLRSQM